MSNKKLNGKLGIRVTIKDRKTFLRKCNEYNKTYNEMLREIIIAFNEDRVQISLPSDQKNLLKEIYNVTRK